MAREYVLSVGGITPTAAATVTAAFINPGTTQSIEILRCWMGQAANATSAQQRVQLNTQVSAFPTLTSTTPGRLKLIDPVSVIVGGTAGAAGTSGTNASAEGAGAKTVLINDAFNVLNGYLWVPTPLETIVMNASAASGFGLTFAATPSPTTLWSWGVIFREL